MSSFVAEKLEAHPIADCFPMMDGAEYAELVADIQVRGIIQPIWIYEGMILDGRNRYKAAAEAGCANKLRLEQYEGDDPVGFVVSLNLKRRNLTASQRAMVAAKLANLSKGEKKADAQPCASEHSQVVTQSEAAKKVGVSRRSVQSARRVREKAAPEVVAKVEAGELSLEKAEETIESEPSPPDANPFDVAKSEAAELRKLMSEVSRIKKRLLEIAQSPIGRFMGAQRISMHAGNLHREIEFALPHALCPYHDATGAGDCTACKGGGWVTRSIYNQAPEELRAA